MGRFEVGNVYPFYIVQFDYADGHEADPTGFMQGRFNPAAGDRLKSIEVVPLRCAEHHRVAWEYRPEVVDHDGYMFVDSDGRMWDNQYPRYAAEQSSIEADWFAMLRIKDAAEADKLIRSNTVVNLESMYRRLRELRRLLESQLEHRVKLSTEHRQQFADFYAQMLSAASACLGQSIKIEPETEIKFTDPDKTPLDISKMGYARFSVEDMTAPNARRVKFDSDPEKGLIAA